MAKPTSYNLSQVRFLIVEDNVNMIALVRSILQSLGAKIIYEAADVPTGLDLLQMSSPDIIICDWQMEPMSGLELVCQIRDESSANPYVPIIMLTAHAELDRVKEARDCGVNEFLVKPISAKSLYARIREIIEHPRDFVRTASYFGPDRRRRQVKIGHAERRATDARVAAAGAREEPKGVPSSQRASR